MQGLRELGFDVLDHVGNRSGRGLGSGWVRLDDPDDGPLDQWFNEAAVRVALDAVTECEVERGIRLPQHQKAMAFRYALDDVRSVVLDTGRLPTAAEWRGDDFRALVEALVSTRLAEGGYGVEPDDLDAGDGVAFDGRKFRLAGGALVASFEDDDGEGWVDISDRR